MAETIQDFKKGWPAIKKAPWHFAGAVATLVVIAGIVIMWHYDMVIHGKDAELGQKNETIRTISEERDKSNRENEKLVKQVDQLKIYRGQDAPPLKQKALILSKQIWEFSKDWKETDSPEVQNEAVNRYLQRFGLRAQIIRDDLDQSGQQSDVFDHVMYNFGVNYKDVRTIAEEIEKLAKKLPD